MIDLDQEMSEFFVRSIDRNTATGVPPPFDIQRSEQVIVQPRRTIEEHAPRVVVTNALGSSPPIPNLTNVQPANGKLSGGFTVTIRGVGFIQGARVFFDNVEATSVVFIDETFLTCTVPAYTHGIPPSGGATIDVKIINITSASNAFQSILANSYTYYVAPTVTSVSPNTGPGTGGTAVTITGTNFIFAGGYFAVFGGSYAATTRVDSTHLTCSTPAHATGAVTVAAVAPDSEHQTGTLAAGFTYGTPSGTPGAQANFICVPSQAGMQHNGSVTLQVKVILDSAGTVDTAYNGVVHPQILGITNNATASFPSGVTITNGLGSFTVQVFLVNLHASGDLYINMTESIFSSNAMFNAYITRFFNP